MRIRRKFKGYFSKDKYFSVKIKFFKDKIPILSSKTKSAGNYPADFSSNHLHQILIKSFIDNFRIFNKEYSIYFQFCYLTCY